MNETAEESWTIAVIEDDEVVNRLVCNILKKNYSVLSYFSAEEALRDAMNNADVIVTDVKLPGMNGIEFLKNVERSGTRVPVIVMTGHGDIDVAISALQGGAFDFILKPFKNEQIVLAVEKALERRRLRMQNERLMTELTIKNRELEILNRGIQSRNIEIERELDIAANLQRCLFPITLPDVRDFEFSLKYHPVEKVSGDFFDFLIFDDASFSFILADVSGHGVPAALYSAMVKTAISTIGLRRLSPSRFIREMNMFLIGAQKKMSYNYVTVFYGVFDMHDGTLTYCNAGMPAPALMRSGGDIMLLESNSPFVGIFESSLYVEDTIALERGDRLLFYTDGLFECVDKDDRILGQTLILELLQRFSGGKISDISESIYAEIMKRSGGKKFDDDITMVGMQYKSVEDEQ